MAAVVLSYVMTPFSVYSHDVPADSDIEVFNLSPYTSHTDETVTVEFYSKYSNLDSSSYSVWVHDWTGDSGRTWVPGDGENSNHMDITGEVELDEATGGNGGYYYYNSPTGDYSFTFTITDSAPYTNGNELELEIILHDHSDAYWREPFEANPASDLRVDGIVYDDQGVPVEDAWVAYYDGTTDEGDSTNAAGEYTVWVQTGNQKSR